MRLFCSGCQGLFSAEQSHIIDPNVLAADGKASVFHSWCYASAIGSITEAQRLAEANAGKSLADATAAIAASKVEEATAKKLAAEAALALADAAPSEEKTARKLAAQAAIAAASKAALEAQAAAQDAVVMQSFIGRGAELHERKAPNFALLAGVANRAPAGNPKVAKVIKHQTAVNSDYTVYE